MIINHSYKSIILIFTILLIVSDCAIRKDIIPKVPGYDDSFKTQIYGGYLNTSSELRKLYYVFVQGAKGINNTQPLTLWLNGGPGCSSLMGFLQEIGPFYIQQGKNYTKGDKLIQNPYSWHHSSNLLFLQSPAGVGYSYNKDTNFTYNDMNTAKDNFDALLNFFQNYPQYSNNSFWLAGQSYAGKYIPDLAILIDNYNKNSQSAKINLKGLLIGNGVMSFKNNELQKSQIQFMIDHDFIDPQLTQYYSRGCLVDDMSAGCQYFKKRYVLNVDDINPFSVYDYCYYNDSFANPQTMKTNKFVTQTGILKQLARKGKVDPNQKPYSQSQCAYFDGLYQYFNAHVTQFHGQDGMEWNGPCTDKITFSYTIDKSGSISQYKQLLADSSKYHIILYNGDWDDVVPYTNTLKNLDDLKLRKNGDYTPYFVNDQHAGFSQLYSGVTFMTVKGASHMVPQSKRPQAKYLFETAMNSHGSQEKFMEIIQQK